MPANGEKSDYAGLIKSTIGLLIVAFTGVLNFIGLKDAEVGSVLRNEGGYPSLVALILALGLTAGVISVFAPRAEFIPRRVTAAIVLLVAAFGSFITWLIPIPFATLSRDASLYVAIILGVVTVLLAVTLGIWPAIGLDSQSDVTAQSGRLSVQANLILVAVLLVFLAGFAALRLEGRTQAKVTPSPQLNAKLTEANGQTALELSVSGSRLTKSSRLGMVVLGLRRVLGTGEGCDVNGRLKNGPSCEESPCLPKTQRDLVPGCAILMSNTLRPSSSGEIKQDFRLLFLSAEYRHISIISQVCEEALNTVDCTIERPNREQVDRPLNSLSPSDTRSRIELSVPYLAPLGR